MENEQNLHQADSFSRDGDICDACLETDFDRKPPSIVLWLSVFLGLASGSVVTALAAATGVGFLEKPSFTSLVWTWAVVCLVLSVGAWLLLIAFGKLGLSRRLDRDEEIRDAERFFYLALWGALRGRRRFARRMLRRAKVHGFVDTSRLCDPRLDGV